MSKFLKYGLIGAAVVALVLVVSYLLRKAKPSKGGTDVKPEGVTPPSPTGDSSKLLNTLSGEGKLLFDTYRAKFQKNEANLSEALSQLNPLSIFTDTKNSAWLDRFVQSSQSIPAILTPKGEQVVESLSKVTPIGSDLWTSVSAIRGANFSIMDATGVNLLPGNPEVDANSFVQDIGCKYASCSGNDKKRNEAVNGKMSAISADFQKILKNWASYNTSANSLIDIYTVEKIKSAGYNIVA